MADFTILVGFSGGAVSVMPQKLSVPYDPGVEKTIEWRRTDDSFDLKSVIFKRPIGTGKPIGVPTPNGNGSLEATDDNSNHYAQKDVYQYMVLVEQNGIVFPSPDPEIVNEPSGGAEDDDDEGPGGGG